MKLEKYKEEVYKCSGCGLCQSACPVYKILKTECAVSRGKFKLLNAIINKDLKYNKKVSKIMDICLHCQACSEFCPSGIDAQKIIETAKFDMLQKGIFNFKQLFIAQFFTNKMYLKTIKFIIDFIRKFKILERIDIFNCPKNKLFQSFLKINIQPKKKSAEVKKTIKVLYFPGCVNNYVNPSSKNAVYKIFDNTPVEITDADFNCCGLPLKSAGDFDSFKQVAKENINMILKQDFDYLVFDCLSCKSTFLEYAEFLDNKDKENALNILKKFISVYELLEIINFNPQANDSSVTIHYPCHTRGTIDKELMKKIVQSIPNINYKEMEEADSCCGCAGSFILTNNKLSKQISSAKAQNIINSNAYIVLTACPACHLGLKQGLIENKSDIKVLQLIEFLAE